MVPAGLGRVLINAQIAASRFLRRRLIRSSGRLAVLGSNNGDLGTEQ